VKIVCDGRDFLCLVSTGFVIVRRLVYKLFVLCFHYITNCPNGLNTAEKVPQYRLAHPGYEIRGTALKGVFEVTTCYERLSIIALTLLTE